MKKIFSLFLFSIFLGSLALPSLTFAQTSKPAEYQMLAPIEQLQNPATGKTDIATFIPAAVKLIISIAAALAVIMIVIGGFKYIASEAFQSKSDAKQTITNALIGLVLAIASYSILYTINPKLIDFSLDLDYQGSSTPIPTNVGTSATTAGGTGGQTGGTGCSNCIQLDKSVPQKGVAPLNSTNGSCKYPGPCVTDPRLATKLIQLANNLRGKVTWEITEMFPPTVTHDDSCHYDGTCVDAALRAITTGRLITFLTEVEKVFPNYIYEVCGSRLSNLQNDLQLAKFKNRFTCPRTTTGESIHINL